jgi:hypothetical protein
LAYKALNGPYNWDLYLIAPLGCKAVIYEAPAVQGSWALGGTDAWLLGPLAGHYHCNLYFFPETRTYQISGSAELFPQHCQVPNLSKTAHLKALTKELVMSTAKVANTRKGRAFIWKFQGDIDAILHPPVGDKQRVDAADTNPPTPVDRLAVPITRISDAPAIMQTQDPTVKRQLIKTKCVHQRQTQNNTPGWGGCHKAE